MKKNLLLVLTLALLIVNIVLTSVMMFSVMGTNKKTEELVSNIATVLNLQLTTPGGTAPTASDISLADTDVYIIESMAIPLASIEGQEKVSYIQFEVALSMNTKSKDYKKYGESMDDKASLIKDAISSVVSTYTEDECRDNMEEMKAEVLQSIQSLFQSDFIYKVSINEVRFG